MTPPTEGLGLGHSLTLIVHDASPEEIAGLRKLFEGWLDFVKLAQTVRAASTRETLDRLKAEYDAAVHQNLPLP